jgi:hypothetical protein
VVVSFVARDVGNDHPPPLVTHPSPPQNVTITDVTASSARLVWSPPDSNAEKVQSYSIYIRKDDHGEPFREVKMADIVGEKCNDCIVQITHATSPHLLLDLEGDYPYMVYVLAHTESGKSLPSTIEEFYTRVPSALDVCAFGQPLFHPNGHRYFCGMGIRQCPSGYECIVSGSETETFCCQSRINHFYYVSECECLFRFQARPARPRPLAKSSRNAAMRKECQSHVNRCAATTPPWTRRSLWVRNV